MKVYVIALSILLLTAQFCYAEDGFRSFSWGIPSSQITGLINKKPWTYPQEFAYNRENDDMTIGDAKADFITYIFWEDKLSSVIIKAPNALKLMNSCSAKWGNPKKIEETIALYKMFWDISYKTEAELRIDKIKNEATLNIYSYEIKAQMRKVPVSTKVF